MILQFGRIAGKAVSWLVTGIGGLLLLLLVLGGVGWLTQFNDSVTLPNAMVLKREFDFTRLGRNDLFAADGKTRLAHGIEFVCFNDRYVLIYAFNRGQSGLFDSRADGSVPGEDIDTTLADSGLKDGGKTCSGYFTGMIGPGLLYDGNSDPFLPSCDLQNSENATLLHRDWFERPCLDD
jgi:hypothetical protein